MSEPYPSEIRQLAGDDVVRGVHAPGAPADPEATATGGGAGTGLVVASPTEPGDQLRADMTPEQREADGREESETVAGNAVDLACLREAAGSATVDNTQAPAAEPAGRIPGCRPPAAADDQGDSE